jgi:hypothetical protein
MTSRHVVGLNGETISRHQALKFHGEESILP